MKSPGAVKHKLTQVRFRYLKKRIEAELRPFPENCEFNTPLQSILSLDGHGDVVAVPNICACPKFTPNYCDVRFDQGDRARRCEEFVPKRSKEQVKEDFSTELNGMALPELAGKYPDMAALIWVLDDEDFAEPSPPLVIDPVVVIAELPPPPVTVLQDDVHTTSAFDMPVDNRPWWKKLLAGASS